MRSTGNPGSIGVVWRSISKYQLLASELVKSEAKEAKAERLLGIYDAVSRLLDQYECELVAVEKCYHNKNVSSSQSTAAVIGAVMVAAASKGIRVVEVTPQQVKASTGLGGRSDKKTIVKMMSKLLRQSSLNNHISDGAACGIVGTISHKTL